VSRFVTRFLSFGVSRKADRGELEATINAQLKEQAEQIQKVSAQIEASRSTPQVVLTIP
jgi:hypothetical protein